MMERVEQEGGRLGREGFEVLTEEEMVGVNREAGKEVPGDVVGTEGEPSEGVDGGPRQRPGGGERTGMGDDGADAGSDAEREMNYEDETSAPTDERKEKEEEWEDEEGDPDDGYVFAVDMDGDGVADFEIPGVKRVVKGEKWRRSLWSARSLALMTQFRLGMTEEEQVVAVGFLIQVELVLIMWFDESVPDPGANWDVEKRAREIERRLARLRCVEEKQREEYGGWKGVWRAVVGRKKVSGKELFQKMLDEADGMMTAMSGVGQSEEVMDKIMQLGGLGFLSEG